MTTTIDLEALPAIPRDADGPTFRAPWEAQAFAMAVLLHQRGHFTWADWTARLATEIAAGSDDNGEGYYRHWLTALEKLLAELGLVPADEQRLRFGVWTEAARTTPHGQPIELPADMPGHTSLA